MTDDAANRFLSWARRGAAAQIETEDPSPTEAARVRVPIRVRFNGTGPSDPFADVSLQLLGPGDVVALDARAIVRTWPPPETRDAEPNYFPLVELDQADLPWRYTPRKANNATGRLRPWLCLIVIEEDQGIFSAQGGGRPDKVSLINDTPLPRIDQSWAWAHVQVSGDDEHSSAVAIKTRPEHVVARLLCPRRLEPNKTYWAMLVPTFAAGVRAGLGIPEDNPNATEDLALAWTGTTVTGQLEPPVYHRWRFGTGQGGDFETLVSALRPHPLPSTVGVRTLDVSQVGALPLAATQAVPIGGALHAPLATPWSWPTDQGERAIFIQVLAALLDLPDVVRALGGTPVVAPPLYGAWHARSWRLQAGPPPTWFRDLNQDRDAHRDAGAGAAAADQCGGLGPAVRDSAEERSGAKGLRLAVDGALPQRRDRLRGAQARRGGRREAPSRRPGRGPRQRGRRARSRGHHPGGAAPPHDRPPRLRVEPADPIEPVMAHPEFPQPMYKPLAARSADWILPGLADVAANSVALAVTNPAFIEAYMVGLNHEMARELLWREYPTDQRGSYFRQFWDPAGLHPTPVPDTAKDIRPLNEWTSGSQLGEHSPRPIPPDATHLVLLVRGEVLRRYPGTLVYAQRAQGPLGNRTLATAQRRPVFGGRLDPDVSFFGFDLALAEVRGGGSDPGWFFVFEEQPSEPRFGLDAAAVPPPQPLVRATSWNELAWHHLAATAYIDLTDALPDTGGIVNPQGAGWHLSGPGIIARGADHALITFQRPVRVAMHGSVLLPP